MLKPTNNHSTRVTAGLMSWWPLDRDVRNYAGASAQNFNDPGLLFTRGGFGNNFLRCYNRTVGGMIFVTPGAGNNFAGLKAGTICAWVFFDAVGVGQQFCFMDATSSAGSTRFGFGLDDALGNTVLYGRWRDSANDPSGTGVNVLSSTAPTAEVWYHVAVTYDPIAGSAKIYINGILDGTQGGVTLPFGTSVTAGQGILGSQDGGIGMNGKMLDVRLYNRALNAAEVKEIYTEPFRTIDNNSIVPGIEPLGWLRQAPAAPAVSAVRRAVYLPKLRDYSPRQMPLGIMPKIKRNHPLAQGLIGCWMPGIALGIDITGNCPPLSLNQNTSAVSPFSTNKEGPSLQGVQTNFTGGNLLQINPAPSIYYSGNNYSCYFRGTKAVGVSGNGVGQQYWIMLSYTNGVTSPYTIYEFGDTNNSDYSDISFGWNDGSVEVKISSGFGIFSQDRGYAFDSLATFNYTGGTNRLYFNGQQIVSNAAPSSKITSGPILHLNGWTAATRYAAVNGNMYCIWNRQLSATDAMLLNTDPYSFLEFDMDRFGWMPGPEGPDISPFRLLGIAEVDI